MNLRIITCAFFVLVSTAYSQQNLKEVLIPPADSADQANLRIWVPVERKSSCRLTVNIFNQNGKIIRHLVDAMIPPGFHNFYWDKKNDSGEFVLAGEYAYKMEDCVRKDSGKVVVFYRAKKFVVELQGLNFKTTLKPEFDSLHLQVKVFSAADSLVGVTLDTIIGAGNYHFDTRESLVLPGGKYYEKLYLNGEEFSKSQTFSRKK